MRVCFSLGVLSDSLLFYLSLQAHEIRRSGSSVALRRAVHLFSCRETSGKCTGGRSCARAVR